MNTTFADWVSEAVLSSARAANELKSFDDLHLRRLLLAIPYQLSAVCEAGLLTPDAVRAVHDIQRQHGVLIDPEDNWFTRIAHRFGQSFDLKTLASDPRAMATKFDRLATRWEEYVAWGRYREVFSWLVESACALAPTERGGRFLDIACGVGLMSHTLRLTGVSGHITGVDISEGMLVKARARGCYDALLRANVNETLPVPDRSADVAICTGALELLDINAVLRECERVVRPGGQLWLSFQHDDGMTPNPTAHQHVFGVTEADAVRALEARGFRVLEAKVCACAFVTPSPDGAMQAVPYLFVRAELHGV